MFCPFCGTQNPDEGAACVRCARQLPRAAAEPVPTDRPRLLRRPAPLRPAPVDGLPTGTVAPRATPAPKSPTPSAPPAPSPRPAPPPVAAPAPAPVENDTLIESAPPEMTMPPSPVAAPSVPAPPTTPDREPAPTPPTTDVFDDLPLTADAPVAAVVTDAPPKWRVVVAMVLDGSLVALPAVLLPTVLFGEAGAGPFWQQAVAGILLHPLGATLFGFICIALSVLQHGPVFSALGATVGDFLCGLTLRRRRDENAPGTIARVIRALASTLLTLLVGVGPFYVLWLSRSGRGLADAVAGTRPAWRGKAR